jgi:hypothetical protein
MMTAKSKDLNITDNAWEMGLMAFNLEIAKYASYSNTRRSVFVRCRIAGARQRRGTSQGMAVASSAASPAVISAFVPGMQLLAPAQPIAFRDS